MLQTARWSPDQWSGVEGDISPGLPFWEATLAMIRENIGDEAYRTPMSATLNGRGLSRYPKTVMTLAYCCSRGLTVGETIGYFGKMLEAHHCLGNDHPARQLMFLKRDDPVSKYVSFPNGINPLESRWRH